MTTTLEPLTEKDEEASSRYADLGWVTIHYNEMGSGDPVVLLHGGALGANSWSNFALNIRPLAEHFRVLAMDMPGYGKSSTWPGRASMTDNAKAVAGLLDFLGIERAHVLGNSIGGATAMTFMVDYPDRVKKLIAMGPAPVGQVAWSTPRVPTEGTRALIAVGSDPSPENWRKFFELFVDDASLLPEDLLQKRMDSVNETQRLDRLGARPAGGWNRPRSLLEQLRDVETPVLLIQGRNDTVVPPENTLMLMAYLQKAELHLFNKCGHWAQYEHAERFNRIALDFLRE